MKNDFTITKFVKHYCCSPIIHLNAQQSLCFKNWTGFDGLEVIGLNSK